MRTAMSEQFRRTALGGLATALLAVLLEIVAPGTSALADGRCSAPGGTVDERVASFWQCVNSLNGPDHLRAEDLGQWARNVIDVDPGACISVGDFQGSAAGMQGAIEVASAGIPPAPPKSADVEARIAAFWARVGALGPLDLLTATDLGQWALNVIDRDPSREIRVDDFRVSTAGMQAAFDRAKASGAPCKPAPTPLPTLPTRSPSPTAAPTVSAPASTATPIPSGSAPPLSAAWGPQYNAPGTDLKLVEQSRSPNSDGSTKITYLMVAVGMPMMNYDLYQRRLGKDPELLAGGPFAPALDGSLGVIAAVHFYRGEPFELALVSRDQRLRVFGRLVPFPIGVTGDGPCAVTIELASAAADSFAIWGRGFQVGESVDIFAQSMLASLGFGGLIEYPTAHIRLRASASDGTWTTTFQPAQSFGYAPGSLGSYSGSMSMSFTGATCSRNVAKISWGSAGQAFP